MLLRHLTRNQVNPKSGDVLVRSLNTPLAFHPRTLQPHRSTPHQPPYHAAGAAGGDDDAVGVVVAAAALQRPPLSLTSCAMAMRHREFVFAGSDSRAVVNVQYRPLAGRRPQASCVPPVPHAATPPSDTLTGSPP